MRTISLLLLLLFVGGLATNGCENSADDRLATLAAASLEQQAEQSKRIAEQSQTVAEASKALVESDAEARRELLVAQAAIADQRDRLEEDRKSLARAKDREPILAAAIESFGLLLACLVPLGLTCYIIYASRTDHRSDDRLVAEFLVRELTSNRSTRLAPVPPAPRLAREPDMDN